MSSKLAGSMETWLSHQLAQHRSSFANAPLIVDVGAYHGDFTAQMLGLGSHPFSQAVLFEPNPQNYDFLRQRFGGDSSVRLEAMACDAQAGQQRFFCAGQSYTGSLLAYNSKPPNESVLESSVKCITLDDYLESSRLDSKLGFLKIDTQGNDLRVLRGAAGTLSRTQPWILVELIYAPLYEGQARPHEIAAFLASHDYVMAAHFNEYYSADGWLSWADACFVPSQVARLTGTQFEGRPTAENTTRSKTVWTRIRRQVERTFQHGRS